MPVESRGAIPFCPTSTRKLRDRKFLAVCSACWNSSSWPMGAMKASRRHNSSVLSGRQSVSRSNPNENPSAGTGLTAGLQEYFGMFKGYGWGPAGYGKRYGAVMADSVSGALIGNAALPIVLHQDPRYFYKGTGTVRERVWYASSFTVRCKGDNGKWQPNYSGILGGMASGGISNFYYPPQDRNGVALTFENTGYGLLGGAVGNLFQEFLVRKLTPHVPDYKGSIHD